MRFLYIDKTKRVHNLGNIPEQQTMGFAEVTQLKQKLNEHKCL